MAEKEHKKDGEHGEEGGHGGGGGGHGAHGGGSHEEHEGAPEWLISFADNVALIMGFFVILLAMNMKEPTAGGIGGKQKNGGAPDNNTRMTDFVIAVREAFNPIDMSSDDPAEAPLRQRIREKQQAGASLQPNDPGANRIDQAIVPTELSSLGGNVNFDDDSEQMSAKGREQAEKIGRRIRGLNWMIEVRGHASPSETYRDVAKGINLSYRRAMAVAQGLVSQGVRWEQIRIVACGDNERNAKREYDRDADRLNQRVEVIVTNDQASDGPGAGSQGKTQRGGETPVPAAPAGGSTPEH